MDAKLIAYKGDPRDSTSPAYGRVDALVKLYNNLMRTGISKLSDQKVHVRGVDGVLTLVGSFEEGRGKSTALMPSQESVDALVEGIFGQVRREVLDETNQSQVIAELNGLRPKYASPVESNPE